jgi:hypothetical protein
VLTSAFSSRESVARLTPLRRASSSSDQPRAPRSPRTLGDAMIDVGGKRGFTSHI